MKRLSLSLKFPSIYLILNSIYFLFIVVCFLGIRIWEIRELPILPDLTSNFKEIKSWYPNFYGLVYLMVKSLLISPIFILLSLYYFCYIKPSGKLLNLLNYNTKSGYLPFVKEEGRIAFLVFIFYLFIYLLVKIFFPKDIATQMQYIITKGWMLHLLLQGAFVLVFHFNKVKNYLKNYLLVPTLPYNLAIFRILFFSYLIYLYRNSYSTAIETVSLPTKVALPYMGWLIEWMPVNPSLYHILYNIGILVCLFIIIGFRTRFFLVINAFIVFYLIATPNFFGKLWHEQIIIWITWFFTFSSCYDVFSIDSLLHKKPIKKKADYSIPIRLIWLTFGVMYFWAGFYKLWDCGFDWVFSDSMVNQVRLEWVQNYDLVPSIRIDKFPLLLQIGGLIAILFEIIYPFIILAPKKRWIAAFGGLLMHNMIGYFMYISFFTTLQVFYTFFIDFNVFFKAKKQQINTFSKTYGKKTLGFGLTIITLNFTCGMLSIDSYPFSAYPKYAMLIPDTLKVIDFEIKDTEKPLNIHKIGKKNNFRWEDYGWLEYNLIKDYENGQDISGRLNDYWAIWKEHNPELRKFKNVEVYVYSRSLIPEEKDNRKSRYHIGLIN